MEQYIPANKAIELLGEKPEKFYYHAARGEISTQQEARPGKGKKNNLYLVSDIEKVKARLREERGREKPPILIDWMYEKDVPAGLKLSQLVYNETVDLQEAALYQGWRKNNPLLTIAAFSMDRAECYATIQLVPLPEKVILDVLRNRRAESSIRPDEIRPYDIPGGYELLATSATAREDMPRLLYELIYKYMQFWLDEMYPDKWIQKIYAQSVSESGERLIQHMFMAPRPDLARNAYELDLSRPPAARIIRQFKAQLEKKAPLPLELQWNESDIAAIAPTTPTDGITRNRQTSINRQPSTGLELPDNLIALKTYAVQKGIAPTTLVNAVNAGKIPIIEGTWKQGRSTIKKALDAEGRRIVDELYGK